jgi:hypothetical protein
MTTILRYQWRALRGDLIRAAIGLVCAGYAASLAGGPAGFLGILLSAVTALFAVFGLRTLWRRTVVHELTDRGIQRSNILGGHGRGFVLPWEDVGKVSLRFYSTRRDRTNGWMHLTLKRSNGGPGQTVSVESTIDHFDALAEAAVRCIVQHGAAASSTSRSNFLALGLDLPEAASGEPDANGTDEEGQRP